MPCYEAPPEYEADARTNAETAVKILCAMVQSAPNYALVPPPLLEWYLAHRRIDLRVARDPRVGQIALPVEAIEDMIKQDIAVIETVLGV